MYCWQEWAIEEDSQNFKAVTFKLCPLLRMVLADMAAQWKVKL